MTGLSCFAGRRSRLGLLGRFFAATTVVVASLCADARAGLPDILTTYFGGPGNDAPVIRFDIDLDKTVFSTPSGTTGFNDMALTSDGRYLTYRSRRINSPPGLFEIDPADGSISLLVESDDAPEDLKGLTALPSGDLLAYGRIEISPEWHQDKRRCFAGSG